ncbi:serine/threonine-protein kinase [Frankia sp. AgKG'84/4]
MVVDAGTGPVFLARNNREQPVLIKAVTAAFARDADFRRRLSADLDRLRELAPFCLATVLDVDVAASPPYVVVEYVDAPTLATSVAEEGPLSAADALRLALGLATSLAALHELDIVLSDLKPANVVLSGQGLRLVDFGLARALNAGLSDNSGTSAAGIGTLSFISPEQVLGRPATVASDIFTWGGVLLFAATGRPPFGQGSPRALLQRTLYSEPDLSVLAPDLRDLVAAAMRKDPKRRPDAAELLEHLLGELPVGDPAPPGATHPPAAHALPKAVAAPPAPPAQRRGPDERAAAVPPLVEPRRPADDLEPAVSAGEQPRRPVGNAVPAKATSRPRPVPGSAAAGDPARGRGATGRGATGHRPLGAAVATDDNADAAVAGPRGSTVAGSYLDALEDVSGGDPISWGDGVGPDGVDLAERDGPGWEDRGHLDADDLDADDLDADDLDAQGERSPVRGRAAPAGAGRPVSGRLSGAGLAGVVARRWPSGSRRHPPQDDRRRRPGCSDDDRLVQPAGVGAVRVASTAGPGGDRHAWPAGGDATPLAMVDDPRPPVRGWLRRVLSIGFADGGRRAIG